MRTGGAVIAPLISIIDRKRWRKARRAAGFSPLRLKEERRKRGDYRGVKDERYYSLD
jgi:hypothetical protein